MKKTKKRENLDTIYNSVSTNKEFWNEEDIIQYVVERTGFTYEKVKHQLKAFIIIMHRLAEEPDTLSINIPKVGKIYAKTRRVMGAHYKYPNTDYGKLMLHKMELLTKAKDLGYSLHEKEFWLNNGHSYGLTFRELEDYQNTINAKH